MSLVAYGSSDDSEESDTEDVPQVVKPVKLANGTTEQNIATGTVSVQPAEIQDDKFSDTEDDIVHKPKDIDGMLKGLPTPKHAEAMVEETDELEDLVKPKPSQVTDIVKPVPKKHKQPVKITIPALPDSDDDDSEPVKKKSRPAAASSGKAGLFSMLPAPVHAPRKESNRILIPYSLSKKPKPPINVTSTETKAATTQPTHISNKLPKMATSLGNYSDSEEEDDNNEGPVNFFSIESSKEKATLGVSSNSESDTGIPTVPLPPFNSRILNLPAPVKTDNVQSSDNVGLNNETSPQTMHTEATTSESIMDLPLPGVPINQDAPLTFKGGVASQPVHLSSGSSSHTWSSEDQNIYRNMPYSGTSQYLEVTDDQAFQHDEQFLKMQGKRGRGKEEINIMDVNADDYTNPDDLMKNLTSEETYQSHAKKDDMPTSQQKRKHQIHYLAFQAKETEMELKNAWANSRQTKKQTQAKYGF